MRRSNGRRRVVATLFSGGCANPDPNRDAATIEDGNATTTSSGVDRVAGPITTRQSCADTQGVAGDE